MELVLEKQLRRQGASDKLIVEIQKVVETIERMEDKEIFELFFSLCVRGCYGIIEKKFKPKTIRKLYRKLVWMNLISLEIGLAIAAKKIEICGGWGVSDGK